MHYLRLCFWPDPLVLDYGMGVTRSVSQVWWQGLLLVGLGGAAIWALVRRPALGFLGAAFFILLGPSSSIVPLVSQTLAEHRMYLPLAAVLTIVSIALIRVGRPLVVPVLALSCVACAWGTVRRVHDYRSELSIWEATVRDRPSNARAFLNLGFSYEKAGDSARAEASYRKAAELEPGYVQPRYNLGLLAMRKGDPAGATACFSEALALSPDFADAHLGLANALATRGAPAEAVPHYQRALALAPAPDVHYNFGLALVRLRRTSEAAAEFREVLASEPGNSAAWYQYGQLQLGAGTKAEGERSLLECLRLEPSHLGALRALGMHFAQTGRLDRAGELFLSVTRLKPDDAEAWGNLGNVALFQGRVDEAIRHYEHALRLDPSNRGLRENLQVAREAR